MKTTWLLPLLALLSVSAHAIPNPSVRTCQEAGGTYATYDSPAGQDGLCRFGRAQIGAWTLDQALDLTPRAPSLAVEAYFNPVRPMAFMPNPASVYCEQSAGEVRILSDRDGNQLGVCVFGDRSVIEEWTLFRGPDAEMNAALTRVLRRSR